MNTQATVLKSYIALLQPTNRARKACANLFFRWSALFVLLALAAESHAQMTVSLTPAWNAWAYNVSSYGGADGSIASSVTGGTTPYSYVWTKGSDTIGLTQNVNGLTTGLYQLIVEDSLGLRDTASVYLSQPSGLSASITPHDPCGLASNSATAYPTGAVGPYSYAWDTGDSVATANGLSAGVHAVLITAANGDTVTTHCTIHTPLALEMSVTANSYGNHLACDGDTATLDLTVSGGVPPYTYLWESGSFSQDLQATTGGLKKVRVWDSRGCMADDSLLLVAASALNMEVQPHVYPNGQGFSCDTCNDGMFVVMNVGGGEPPYTIAWSTGATGDTLFNIIPDTTYTITITDAQGCTLSDGGAMPRGNLQGDNSLSVVIDAPHWAGGYHVSCSTCSDAKVLLYPSGGQPPYAILWADGDTSRYRYTMAAGDYTVTIFDQMGDSLVRNITLIGPSAGLDAQISNMTTVNNGLITGGLNAMVNGGVPPYSYVWKQDGSVLTNTWSYLNVSQTGTYSLVVTDATSGRDSATVVVSLPEDTTMEAAAPPAWGMYGNAGNGDILEGEGAPWFGTADSTDVVMKANGVPQLRLGANGVTSVEGQLRLAQLQEAEVDTTEPQFKLMVAGDDGMLAKISFDAVWQNISKNSNDCFNNGTVLPLQVQGQWYSGINKLYSCPSVNVGIGTDVPQSKLDVRGNTYSHSLSVNTYAQDAKVTIKGGTVGQQNQFKALEVQDNEGSPSLRVFNDGKVIIGFGGTILNTNTPILLVRTETAPIFCASTDGKVSIGNKRITAGPHTDYTLSVDGKLVAKDVVVTTEPSWWPDFVFEEEYCLMELSEVETFVREHGHLPDVPSEKQVRVEGQNLAKMNALLLLKLEELYLHVIKLDKEIQQLKATNP